ncbi:hypothetical protein FH972_015197 [Carpinus fangiana]|uniref:3-beta hydroxysteroid dehydrogenase/isomerase domain-containing protein n=1 Tax=Carpinus fangiana TaxID=176857 RepID=A0A5N6RD33_9ROSI|nr:hypothetical protein FH972_015197 [Carpinus fangiana]
MEERLAELNPRTCVVLGGRGFLGRSLVHRLLTLCKWIVRVADSAQSLQLHPSGDHHDSLLPQALSSGRASYHRVWLPSKCEKRKVNLNVTYARKSSQPDRVVVIRLVDQKTRGRKGKESVRSCGDSTPAELDI